MTHLETVHEVQDFLRKVGKRRRIGLVPTMGALHEGHLSLIRQSKKENDLTVCSVFVNPKQFNNPDDLKSYPRDITKDASMLRKAECDLLFEPNYDEMYPTEPTFHYDFGSLETVMEGHYRPGHFNGVATVVNRLFEIVRPARAYFGSKDFQQVAIVRQLVKKTGSPVEIVACPTVREKNGLAMSSRNQLLSPQEKEAAANIYRWLEEARAMRGKVAIPEVKAKLESLVKSTAGFTTEYIEIADANSLQPLKNWPDSEQVVCCIAVYLGKIRLIDNILF